jgi:hypothetical protein
MTVAARLVCISIGLFSADSPSADESRSQWFKSLTRPGTGISCCDIADCRRTDARWRRDGWWAVVLGKWRPIPPETIVTTPRSFDGEAYVCAGDERESDAPGNGVRIFCFVPPDMGW